VTTRLLGYLTEKFTSLGFEWSLPVIFSKCTDPLWPDPGASIEKRIEVEVYGETVRTTLSMIIHKLVASSLLHPKLFILSPNVRVERRERKSTGWHIYEFTQLDFEARSASSKDIMQLGEVILQGLVEDLNANCSQTLDSLRDGKLRIRTTPFEVFDREELVAEYGKEWESRLPLEIQDPVWVTDIPREFYDYQDLQTQKWDNYDLFLPGYGEVLSGARREWEYEKILTKMQRDEVAKENYALLLRLAREGRLMPSAGAGIGVERLVSWIVGARHIGEVQPFPKIPGTVYDL
jgi:asparaginyl-tRNA synthetase